MALIPHKSKKNSSNELRASSRGFRMNLTLKSERMRDMKGILMKRKEPFSVRLKSLKHAKKPSKLGRTVLEGLMSIATTQFR